MVIGEERVCPICHKRLGKSVISVFPDGQVVHYGCGNKLANANGADPKEQLGGLRRFGTANSGSKGGGGNRFGSWGT